MKKTALALTLIMALLFSVLAITQHVNLASAQSFSGSVTINNDGTVSPASAPIQRVEDTYTFSGDIEGSIWVVKSNIIIDGNGFKLQGSGEGSGFSMFSLNNVTVRNTIVENFYKNFQLSSSTNNTIHNNAIVSANYTGIYLDFSSNYNSIYDNNITDNENGILLSAGSNYNSIHNNNITNNGIGLWLISRPSYNQIYCNNILNNDEDASLIESCSNNEFYLNNFIDNTLNAHASSFLNTYDPECINIWGNGSMGNYWSDYLTRYPNASEVGNSGIGHTPYLIEYNNTDVYPLMYPYDIENDTISFPKPELQTAIVIGILVVVVVLVAVGVLVYFKKRTKSSGL